jgi:hypothetical protein
MITRILSALVTKAERRIGVKLDYAHQIAQTDFGLMMRYGKIFGFLDPNTKVPAEAYHIARLRGAISADCGTCVEAEINLAKTSGLTEEVINAVLRSDYSTLSDSLRAAAQLTDAVTGARQDAPEARQIILETYGDPGLIELSYAMNGAALLPGIKRAMGHATTCDLTLLSKMAS